jgi:hypothetical protein
MLVLIGCTFVLGVSTGFLSLRTDFSWGPVGQIIHGLLCIGCFVLVGAAFWRFGWKIGVLDLFLVFVAGNVGLSA